ncbi:MAG: hypothetical protein K1Y36_10935 [Blastocatellia bacterium]|nr:hypothetical protein [Blastocatellia bacterium]
MRQRTGTLQAEDSQVRGSSSSPTTAVPAQPPPARRRFLILRNGVVLSLAVQMFYVQACLAQLPYLEVKEPRCLILRVLATTARVGVASGLDGDTIDRKASVWQGFC